MKLFNAFVMVVNSMEIAIPAQSLSHCVHLGFTIKTKISTIVDIWAVNKQSDWGIKLGKKNANL